MVTTSKCDLCDCSLEFEADGQRMVFTAHDAEFCRIGTIERIRNLERAMESLAEQFKHGAEGIRRQVDLLMAKHGLPSLDRQAEIARIQAMAFLRGEPVTCHQLRYGLWCADGKRGVFEVGDDRCKECGVIAWKHSTLPRCEEKR